MNDKETGHSYLVVQLFSLEESCVRAWKQKITKLTGLSNVHVALHWDKTQGIIIYLVQICLHRAVDTR